VVANSMEKGLGVAVVTSQRNMTDLSFICTEGLGNGTDVKSFFA